MISFGSLKEAHNNLCAEKKDYKSKWLGDPYIDDGDISVSAYKCCKCGIEIWQLWNSKNRKCYRKIPSEFIYSDGVKQTV